MPKKYPTLTPVEAWTIVGEKNGWANPGGFARMVVDGEISDKERTLMLNRAIEITGPGPSTLPYATYHRSDFFHYWLTQFANDGAPVK